MVKARVVGVSDHAGWAVLVTLAAGKVVDRRRVELLDEGLPAMPHHHEGSFAMGRYAAQLGHRAISIDEVVALVGRVRASAERNAQSRLESLAAEVPGITDIAIRACPVLPDSVEGRIRDTRAQTMADGVMFREVLGSAAEARGWTVHWYEREVVLPAADSWLRALGRSLGSPWNADHKLASAAALAVLQGIA